MARSRAFDEQAALEAAVAHFWSRGYEAASVRDLAECMGIGGASLYNAYGGKRDLFILALDHYCDVSTRERLNRIERTHAGRNAISAFFDDIIAHSVNDKQRKGCFLVNSAVELASHDSELREIIGSYHRGNNGLFQQTGKPRPGSRRSFSIHRCGTNFHASAGRCSWVSVFLPG